MAELPFLCLFQASFSTTFFFRKFIFKEFLIKKTNYVLIPYLFLSTIPVFFLFKELFYSGQYEQFFSFPIIRHYLTGVGESFLGYWYIPFIMIIFFISPLFIWFIRQKIHSQILVSLLLFIISVFLHRGTYTDYTSVFQTVLFYLPLYLFGILTSEKKELIFSKLKGKEIYILVIALTLALIQVFMGKLGNYRKDPFLFGGIDFMIIQKTFLCFFFIIWLNRFETLKFKLSELIAINSFGIFFTHGIIIVFLNLVKDHFNFAFSSNSFFIYLGASTLVFTLSLAITLSVKKVLPEHSRFLVGS